MNRLGIFDPVTEFTRAIPADRDGRVEGDTIRIGGDYCPGIALPRKASDPRKWDKRPGYGLSGATLIYMGDDLSQFSIDVSIWTQTQMDEFKIFYAKYLKRAQPNTANISSTQVFAPNIRPKALGIFHPALAIISIDRVQVVDVTQFEQVADGLWGCTIELSVDRPPAPMLFKPDGKIPDVAKKTPTARDTLELQIQKLTDENKALYDNLARGGK